MGAGSGTLDRMRFAGVLVDEASQATELVCIYTHIQNVVQCACIYDCSALRCRTIASLLVSHLHSSAQATDAAAISWILLMILITFATPAYSHGYSVPVVSVFSVYARV
jgi:hypothetical protein